MSLHKQVTRTVLVTPEMAEKWLEGNVHNRPLSDKRVGDYERLMRAGKWHTSHQGIAFSSPNVTLPVLDPKTGQTTKVHYKKPVLLDGQTRLWAILNSGIAQTMSVSNHVAIDALPGIDTGQGRTATHAYKIATGHKAPEYILSAVKVLVRGPNQTRRVTNEEVIDVMLENQEAVNFITEHFNKTQRYVKLSIIAGAIMRCYKTIAKADHPILAGFCEALLSGEHQPELTHNQNTTTVRLRNFLFKMGGGKVRAVHGRTSTQAIYYTVERALRHVLDDAVPVKTLSPAAQELFPQPGEKLYKLPKDPLRAASNAKYEASEKRKLTRQRAAANAKKKLSLVRKAAKKGSA